MSGADEQEIIAALKSFIVDRVLDGQGEGIDEKTPLLELGIVDSLTTVALIGFVEQRFGVRIPDQAVGAVNFRNIEAIAALIRQLA